MLNRSYCSYCRKGLDIKQFYRTNSKYNNGLTYICKQCSAKKQKEYHSNPDNRIKLNIAQNKRYKKKYWREAEWTKFLLKIRYRELKANKALFYKQKEYLKQWKANNKDKISEYNRRWQEKNQDKVKARNKSHYQLNKEKMKQTYKEWYKNNPDKIRQYRMKKEVNNG